MKRKCDDCAIAVTRKKERTLGRQRLLPYTLIDISLWMDDFTFEGDQPFEVTGPLNWITGSNPEFVYDLKASTQTGTHIQGPHYFLEEGKRIETFPLEAFEGWAHIVEMEKRGEDT